MYKNKFIKNSEVKILLPLVFILLFIYIILFEFILPVNRILPRPSILIESLPSIFNDYNFLNSYIFTVSIIYSVLLVSYFVLKFGGKLLIKLALTFPELKGLVSPIKYFLPVLLIFLFEIWFGNSFWGEYLFIFIIVMTELKSVVIRESLNINEEYIDAAKSLGLKPDQIISEVIWKTLQPKIYSAMLKSHLLLWSLAIVYEFVCSTQGIGNIFKLAVNYNDLSIILTLIIFIIITVLFGKYLLNKIRNKFFFWND